MNTLVKHGEHDPSSHGNRRAAESLTLAGLVRRMVNSRTGQHTVLRKSDSPIEIGDGMQQPLVKAGAAQNYTLGLLQVSEPILKMNAGIPHMPSDRTVYTKAGQPAGKFYAFGISPDSFKTPSGREWPQGTPVIGIVWNDQAWPRVQDGVGVLFDGTHVIADLP